MFSRALGFLRRRINAIPIRSRYCCICQTHVLGFQPYRGWKDTPHLMKSLAVIGSDVKQFGCPRCNSHDRERHLFLFFKKTGIFQQLTGASVLHFAPELKLSAAIRERSPAKYIRCDLYPNSPEIEKIDMLNIPYDSETFDFVIANHVLEHIPDDLAALKELYRVCKKGGFAILQTPYSSKLVSTLSDPGIDCDFTRLQLYGQEDHVRLYGQDIFDRFESVGFKARVARHEELLHDINPVFFGVNADEPFFLFERTK